MSLPAFMAGDALAYQGPRTEGPGQRTAAMAAAIGLHVAVIGGFLIMSLRPSPPPPERTIAVSFITESAAAAAPTPPQPPQPPQRTPTPPERQMIATARPTASTITAPPLETPQPQIAPSPAPTPSPPAPPAAPSDAAPEIAAVVPPNFTAAYLNNPGPVYPPSSRRKREEGVVRLRVQVSAEGAPAQVLVDRSSGFAELDAAAADVVKRRWRFVAAKQAGAPVSAWVIVPMEFSLKR